MSWITTLFAAEAIPAAMITYVALLMFMQMGMHWGEATLAATALTLPWTARPLLQPAMARTGHLALQLRVAEAATFAALVWLALGFAAGPQRLWHVVAALTAVATLCAWHEMAARHHYARMLRRPMQRFYNLPKMFASQTVAVVTYGFMLVGVGFLEVFYHNRRQAMALSWSTAVYVLAGVYLLLVVYNMFAIPGSAASQYLSVRTGAAKPAPLPPGGGAPRPSLPAMARAVALLALLLLPQSLMFHARVVFFVAPRSVGGLGATLQWVGLAQGTVGVIAFSVGLALGYALMAHGRHAPPSAASESHASRLRAVATAMLPLSPAIYLALAHTQPTSLLPLCVATFAAQFVFGFGLNACATLVADGAGQAYDNATGYLYIPCVALAMLLPTALSGFALEHTSFQTFFAINTLCIPLAWAAGAAALRHKQPTAATNNT